MVKTFVTSDTHFGHQNIIKYSNRPFDDWKFMGEELIKRWNSRVGKADTVYFLGDFAMGPEANPAYVADVIRRLNGHIIAVLGNHDAPSKYSKGLYELVVTSDLVDKCHIHNNQIHEERIDGKNFVMCHFPFAEWNGKHHGAICLHGHSHTEFSLEKRNDMITAKRYDIGVDMYGGPVEITGDLRYLNDPKGWQ